VPVTQKEATIFYIQKMVVYIQAGVHAEAGVIILHRCFQQPVISRSFKKSTHFPEKKLNSSDMNRIFIITLYTLLIVSTARSQQVGVGTTQPDPSAALDISSSNKGLLIPRVDLAANNITTPATGLMVFNTNSNYSGGTGLFINLGTGTAPQWTQLVANTSGNFIRNQTGQQANGNFNIAGSGVIGTNLEARRIAVNKTFPNYELDVNGTVYSNNLYAQSTVLAPVITASMYFNMDVQYIRRYKNSLFGT
jgi:hypothetical protein